MDILYMYLLLLLMWHEKEKVFAIPRGGKPFVRQMFLNIKS